MLKFYYTAGNTVLGGAIGNTVVSEAVSAVFPSITNPQTAIDGVTRYACLCVKNETANTVNLGIYLKSKVTSGTVLIAKGLTGKNSTTEQSIANQTTAPTGGLIFEDKAFEYDTLNFGLLNPGDFHHLRIKCETPANSPGSAEEYIKIKAIAL